MTTVGLPRVQSGAEPQRLLTTLLGDFWYWRDEHIPSSALVRLLGEFGVSPDGARAAMRRLHARGLLTVSRSGRTTAYGIPERTSEVIVRRTHRLLSFGATAPEWDGRWTVVAFSIPEESRDARAALRAGLRLHHFGALYDGLWVCPHDRVQQVLGLLEEVGVTTATVLRSDVVPGSPASGSPARAFDLAPLNAAYLAFAERYEPLLEHVRSGGMGSAEALVTRTRLRVDWRDFPESDPDLPAELLPEDWARPRARTCFLEIYDALGALAELRFRQVLAEADPALARLATHHDSATVARLHDELGQRSAEGETPFERARRQQVLSELLPQEQGAARRRPKR
jgi:phenylacetic acid degradation operon negative regulatory protein